MIVTHTADVYKGKIYLCAVKADPLNRNMVFGLVVRDTRWQLHTGSRVWIAASQTQPKGSR